MKKFIYFILPMLILASCSDEREVSAVQERNGLVYAVDETEPFTGRFNGTLNGKKSVKHYKDGKADGLWTFWYENGQKEIEENYKDGKEDGLSTAWFENGKKSLEIHTKDGNKDGRMTMWSESGQKIIEAHYKEDKKDGLWIEWYENGQKKTETSFKNDKLINQTSWDQDGDKQ